MLFQTRVYVEKGGGSKMEVQMVVVVVNTYFSFDFSKGTSTILYGKKILCATEFSPAAGSTFTLATLLPTG